MNSVTLTIYTPNFDSCESVVNNGMSGKVFVDMDDRIGQSFGSIDQAIEWMDSRGIQPNRIEFEYLTSDGVQSFRRFFVQD